MTTTETIANEIKRLLKEKRSGNQQEYKFEFDFLGITFKLQRIQAVWQASWPCALKGSRLGRVARRCEGDRDEQLAQIIDDILHSSVPFSVKIQKPFDEVLPSGVRTKFLIWAKENGAKLTSAEKQMIKAA